MRWLAVLMLLFVAPLYGQQQDSLQSQLRASPEANETIAREYYQWQLAELVTPPVLCLYGHRFNPTAVYISAVRMFDKQRCPQEVLGQPLFGIGYFVPPAFDSHLARTYFTEAACQMVDRLTTPERRAPDVVIIVYTGNMINRASYVYCINYVSDDISETGWH